MGIFDSIRSTNLQADKITTLTNAAGVEVEAIWATLLAKALEGKDVKELLSNVGSGGGAPAVSAGGAPAAGGAAAAAEEAPAAKEEEAKEESDDDMVRLCSAYLAMLVLLITTMTTTIGLRVIRLSNSCRLMYFFCLLSIAFCSPSAHTKIICTTQPASSDLSYRAPLIQSIRDSHLSFSTPRVISVALDAL